MERVKGEKWRQQKKMSEWGKREFEQNLFKIFGLPLRIQFNKSDKNSRN